MLPQRSFGGGHAVAVAAVLAVISFGPRETVARKCDVEETNPYGIGGLAKWAEGCPSQCSMAVAPQGDICTGICVENATDCSKVNSHATVEVNGVCKACSEMSAELPEVCRTCHAEEDDTWVCDSCFPGFELYDNACIVESQAIVFGSVEVIVAIVTVLLVGIFVVLVSSKVNAIIGGCKRRARKAETTLSREVSLLGRDAPPEDDDSDSDDSDHGEVDEDTAKINKALHHGKSFAVKSAISAHVKKGVLSGGLTKSIGLGIPLFFHTQFFLILISLVSFLAVYHVESGTDFATLVDWSSSIEDDKCSQVNITQIQDIAVAHGENMCGMCFRLWLVLLLMSWAFVGFETFVTMSDYDKSHATYEDYTVELRNVPRWVTSEETFLRILKDKFPKNASEALYGVSIVFDIKHIEEQVREKIDRLVEYDDAKNNWMGDEIKPDFTQIEAAIAEDKRWLEYFLKEGLKEGVPPAHKIEGSGKAFLVFKTQKAMQLVLKTIRGIQFEESFMPDFGRRLQNGSDGSDEEPIIDVVATRQEPPGLCWYCFNIPPWKFHVQVLTVYGVSGVLFLVFAWLSWEFYRTFMRPYIDAGNAPDQADASLQIVGNIVGVFNALIQMVVQELAKGAGFTRFAEMDRVVYDVNTVVVALNFLTQLFFFCWRTGFTLDLSKASNYDLKNEIDLGTNMLAFMVPNLFFIQYFLNEILTAGLPSIINRLVLNIVYVWKLGPDGVRKQLLTVLPIPAKRMEERQAEYPKLAGRVAEQGLMYPELLMSLEYTFVIVYPMASFLMLFFVTVSAHYVFLWLMIFAIVFFLWQRYVNVWMLRVTLHDTPDVWWANINTWGVALSMVSTASVWWFLRVNADLVSRFHALSILMVMVFALSYGIYLLGILAIHTLYIQYKEGPDYDGVRTTPFSKVLKTHDYNWWNVNPVYVLRHRYCADLPGYECHRDETAKCWPDRQDSKGFYEPGKGFRLRQHADRSTKPPSQTVPTRKPPSQPYGQPPSRSDYGIPRTAV